MDFLLQSFEDLESFSRFCVKKKRSTPTKPNQNQSSEKRKSLIVTFNHFPRIIGNAAPRSPPRSSVGKQNCRRFSFFSPQDGLKAMLVHILILHQRRWMSLIRWAIFHLTTFSHCKKKILHKCTPRVVAFGKQFPGRQLVICQIFHASKPLWKLAGKEAT